VIDTIFEAIVLVVLVVILFLQSWRVTLIPAVAVPVSLIGAFAGMQALGFSINTLTLFGMVLAIGIVVDDAIVVVEAVEHHIEEGHSPREAAQKAMPAATTSAVDEESPAAGGMLPSTRQDMPLSDSSFLPPASASSTKDCAAALA
jgi:multidrug efflux pump subunit AcrB